MTNIGRAITSNHQNCHSTRPWHSQSAESTLSRTTSTDKRMDQPGDRAPMTKRNRDQNIQDWVDNGVYIYIVYIVYITTIFFIYYYIIIILLLYYYYIIIITIIITIITIITIIIIVIKYIVIKDWVMWDSAAPVTIQVATAFLGAEGRRRLKPIGLVHRIKRWSNRCF